MPRSMEIETPLGDDVLLFHRMHAREELGRSSEFHLELLSDPRTVIDFDKILGKNVTVKVTLADESRRYFNGFVTRFAAAGRHGGYLRFTATVSPWAWFLTRTSDCRIFQEKTVREILEDVFADHPMADFQFELAESYDKWTYCVQYRETDFNFVSRLLEHEGIYYYYRHIDGGHTMVLTDSIDKHEPFPGYEALRYIRPQELVRPDVEHIHRWEFSREVQPGVFALDDFDFERPSVDLRLKRPTPRNYSPSDYEWFDYPGLFTKKPRGEQLAQVRGEEFGSHFERSTAMTNARGVAAGAIFSLEGFPRDDQNGKHLVVSTVLDVEFSDYEAMPETGGSDFQCRFVAMTTAQPFRPRRITPKPFVQGPQTAVVVGPGGEEIYTDNYGRVKVQFHWDSRGQKNENSSCWIRVSHPWAGKAWGAVALPRIGQEVVVDFLEGDPDQPIITGRVYNAEQMPPYELPANRTQTGIKSRSSLGGSPANFNEIRFEDKKGSEELFIHAEKDQKIEVEHDESHWVGRDRKKTIDRDETTLVKGHRTETVEKNETITIQGQRTELVEKNETITIRGNRTKTVAKDESITIRGNRSAGVGKNEFVSVEGNRTLGVTGLDSTSVGKNQSVTVKGDQGVSIDKKQTIRVGDSRALNVTNNDSISVGKNRQSTAGENDSLKAGKNLILAAGEQITIQTGKASITMQKNGNIVIKGKDITLEGSGKINVKATGNVVIKGSKVIQN